MSLRWHPAVMDAALAAVVAVLLTATVVATPDAGPADYAAVLAGSFALVAWRRAPSRRCWSPRCACWSTPRTRSPARRPPSL
ncbi:hypothetical protein [Nonomuraea sp. NPDC001023]|uniref:hypothetical protein n=1 Tax=Nonomuraea sp. NPDC001023 TaxID=3154770 RepID=UPI00331D6D92